MNIKQTLRYLILAGIFIIPFLVLYVAQGMFFPFITGKNFAFRIIVEIMFAAWVLLALLDRSYAPKRSPVLWIYAGLVAVMILADLFGVAVSRSVWSNYERMEGLVAHLHFFMYFLVLGSMLKTERMWHALLKTSLAASVIMSFYGLAQLAGKVQINQGGVRLDGTFGNAAYLAIYMTIHIFIAGYFLVREREVWKKWVFGLVMLLETYILYHTATRGAILGLLGGAILSTLVIAIFGREYPRLRKASIGGLAALVLLVGGFFAAKDMAFVRESPVLGRFASISATETTTISRFLVWNMAWQGFLERPVLGWGHENFNYVFNKYYDPRMYNQEQWFDRTHNVFLDWLIAAGVPGLALYLGLYGAILYFVWRAGRLSLAEKSVITGLLAAYFVHNLFVFDNLGSYILFFTFAAFAHWLAVEGGEEKAAEPLISREAALFGFAPVVALALVGSIYYVNIRPIEANMALIDTMRTQDPALQLASFKKALSYDTFGNPEIRERLLTAAQALPNDKPEVRNEYISYAKAQMDEQLRETPNDARHQLFMGSFLSKIGLYDEALKHLDAAHNESPKKQSILVERGVAYLGKGEKDAALASFKTAYELEPDYLEAKAIYAVGALYAGQADLADRLLAELGPEYVSTSDTILNTYAELGLYDRALSIWRARLSKQPDNPQYLLAYAATLFKSGRIQDSIAELEKIKALDTRYAQQIDYYIKEIREGRDPTEN